MANKIISLALFFSVFINSVLGDDPDSERSFEQHIAKLKTKLPSSEFHIVVQRPFVVIGDDDLRQVEAWSDGTVKWAVSRLKKQYFRKDPDHIVDIWLFKDKHSYEKNCEAIVGFKPHTPFGFYSPTRKSLVMNISTGGGTLVHEIVHPFIESNFPNCPSWFNEGLASLYEQCGDKNGKIWGKTNWRLRGLRMEIKSKQLPTLKELCETTTERFYRSSDGDNYAQARYLCYYLQEKGKLQRFYNSFRDNVKTDPSGVETLKRVLGESDMDAFNTRWQKYCLELRYPE